MLPWLLPPLVLPSPQAFIIGYGQVQSWTPQLVLQPLRQSPANKYVELLWNGVLIICPTILAALVLGSNIFTAHMLPGMIAVLVVGLAGYCFVFAVNSSVHSYLIVRYSEGDKVAMNVGFYYMANAMGRLIGESNRQKLIQGAPPHAPLHVFCCCRCCFVPSGWIRLLLAPCMHCVVLTLVQPPPCPLSMLAVLRCCTTPACTLRYAYVTAIY
jgi:hypothetical protein